MIFFVQETFKQQIIVQRFIDNFINNEEFDPFLWNSMEIKLILTKLQPHLVEFKNEIKNIFNHFIKLLKSSSNSDLNFDFDKLRKNFIDDSKEQFR